MKRKEENQEGGKRGKKRKRFMEARGGIEPPIKVLQTFALPLGYRATGSGGN
jgi:hypothetical protein